MGRDAVHQGKFEEIKTKSAEPNSHKPTGITIIGIEPKEIDWGTEPSVDLQQKIPQIIKVVLKEIGID